MKFLSKLICILFLLFSLMIVQSSSVEAAFPGYNGKIVFSSDLNDDRELYLDYLGSENPLKLTESEGFNSRPKWSPDGTKIAFASTRDGNSEIYIVNADGSSSIRLTNNTANDDAPSWHPLGTHLVFRSDRDGNQEIYTMEIDGTNVVRLTNNNDVDTTPDWSPNSEKVVFTSNRDGNLEIYQMNPDGTNVDRLTNNTSSETEPRWSPDGKKISFRSDMDGPGQIFVMNSDGTNITNITQTSFAESYPSWSPDGKKIVFTSLRDGNHEIYIMNADGSKQERLTYNEVIDSIPSWQPIPNREPTVSDDQLTLSFNGSKTIDVLVNDSDEEALDPAHLTIHTQPKNGTASIIDGKVKYVAKSGFAGSDELTYQICDSFLLDQKCATGVLSITVQSGPKPPAPKIEKVGSVELNNSNKVYYTSNRPTFSGKAGPFSTVKVEIHSDPIVLTTQADANGNWSITPEVDIPNGEHTVKIFTIKDGVASDPVSFVLGINVGLAETGSTMLPLIVTGLVGALGVVSVRRLNTKS